MTLEQARQVVRERLREGLTCPCCGQYAKLYRRRLNSGMAKSLRWLVQEHERTGKLWIDIPADAPKYVLNSRELGKLIHWELVRQPSTRPKPGLWQVTDKGREFVKGNVTVPSHVYLYDNRVYRWTETTLTFAQAINRNVDLGEIMADAGVAVDPQTNDGPESYVLF